MKHTVLDDEEEFAYKAEEDVEDDEGLIDQEEVRLLGWRWHGILCA